MLLFFFLDVVFVLCYYCSMKMIKDDRKIEEILEEGLACEAEILVCEAVDIIATMTEHVQKSGTYQKLIEELGPECEGPIIDFIISFACSEIATLTAQFKNRVQPTIKA